MNKLHFLFAAYTLIWICLCLFLLRLASKVAALEKKMAGLEEKQN